MAKMSKEERKALIKAKKIEIREQNVAFKAKVAKLLDRKYRYSFRYENLLVGDDGKAHINVDLTKVDSPFSVYSYDSRVDSEIYAYIDNAAFFLRSAVPVVINFDDDGRYSDEMKDKIKKAVIRHYALEFEDHLIEHRRKILYGWLSFFIGVIFLAVMISLKVAGLDDLSVFFEIITIFSWVFVWQSIDIFFFSGHERRIDIYNAAQLAVAEISFGKPE